MSAEIKINKQSGEVKISQTEMFFSPLDARDTLNTRLARDLANGVGKVVVGLGTYLTGGTLILKATTVEDPQIKTLSILGGVFCLIGGTDLLKDSVILSAKINSLKADLSKLNYYIDNQNNQPFK